MVDHQGARGLWHHSGLWDGGAEARCGRVAAVAVGWDDDEGDGGVEVVAVGSLGQSASGTPPRLSRKEKEKTTKCCEDQAQQPRWRHTNTSRVQVLAYLVLTDTNARY